MSDGQSMVASLMLFEKCMRVGGHREVHVDEFRRAVTQVGRWAKHKFYKEHVSSFCSLWFDGEDVYNTIITIFKSLERQKLAQMYQADGEIICFESEMGVELFAKRALEGQESWEIQLLLPLINQAYIFYNQSVLQKHGGDFY